MREPRNPFRLRSSEHIDQDATFLRLFEPGILDVFSTGNLWSGVRLLRSAAGAGKTSLLRLFTPSCLLTLHAHRKQDDWAELYQRLKDLEAVDDAGPRVLGVMLQCGRYYAALADLSGDSVRRDRMFFGLLNARIILAALRGALTLRKLDFPAALPRLRIEARKGMDGPPGLALPCGGDVAYEWARSLEATVSDVLDGFHGEGVHAIQGHESLMTLSLLRHDGITLDGTPVAERTVLMMDDVYQLALEQRETLVKSVVDLRSDIGVWIAERLEALRGNEILSTGASQGRDYEEVIVLENYWRKYHKRFEKLVMKIADRRAQAAVGVEIDSFGPCLQQTLEGDEEKESFERACAVISGRIKTSSGADSRFKDWINARDSGEGTPRERALAWRTLEILIEREKRKQRELFESSLAEEELEERDDSSVNTAADLFLAREFGFPYYFGQDRLARLASSNIQQFLGFAASEFGEIVSAFLMKRPRELSAGRQQAILKEAAESVWKEIPNRVRNGRDVRAFLEAIGKFSRDYTYQPNAPNDPGVSGIAISMNDRDRLLDPQYLQNRPDCAKLADVIVSAIAHNLLEPVLDYKVKGGRWMVLNLNRLFCVRFDLPLGYGLFKEKPLNELSRWLEHGYTSSSKQGSFL